MEKNEQPCTCPECTTEASQLGRIVTVFAPFFAIFAGWLAGFVGKNVPGVALDPSQIAAFMLTATTAVLSTTWKWMQGWQQHELLVSQGSVAPRRHVHNATCPVTQSVATAKSRSVRRAARKGRAPSDSTHTAAASAASTTSTTAPTAVNEQSPLPSVDPWQLELQPV
ncbi:hypothetical protein SAMN05444157_0547 [Frankineae bacterium MT45]|nr:hypothetical protein SAMN05444157_0547 [Frankineae bacterium MT45]